MRGKLLQSVLVLTLSACGPTTLTPLESASVRSEAPAEVDPFQTSPTTPTSSPDEQPAEDKPGAGGKKQMLIDLLVADQTSNVVLRFNARGGFTEQHIGSHELAGPTSLAVDEDGHLWVSNLTVHAGPPVDRRPGTGNIIEDHPRDYVISDLREFDAKGAPVRQYRAGGDFKGGVSVKATGAQVYALGRDSHNVVSFDRFTGDYLGSFGEDLLTSPQGMQIRDDGTVFVAHDGAPGEKVLVFSTKPHAMLAYGFGGSELSLASDILLFEDDDRLLVADYNSDKVLMYDGRTGRYLGVFVEKSSGGLLHPTNLAWGIDGRLYVSHENGVLRYDGESGEFVDEFIADAVMGTTSVRGILFRAQPLSARAE